MDHDWKDYLGAGISGFFGGLGGNNIIKGAFAVAGGLADVLLSGDLEENGFGNTMLSIVISFEVGELLDVLSHKIVATLKTINLKKIDEKVARNVLENMNIKRKLIKSNFKTLSKAVYYSNWIGNIVSKSIGSSIVSSASSILYGLISDDFRRRF